MDLDDATVAEDKAALAGSEDSRAATDGEKREGLEIADDELTCHGLAAATGAGGSDTGTCLSAPRLDEFVEFEVEVEVDVAGKDAAVVEAAIELEARVDGDEDSGNRDEE